jgi:hypothetical protein
LNNVAILLLAGLAALGAAKAPPPRWWAPGDGRNFPERIDYPNAYGSLNGSTNWPAHRAAGSILPLNWINDRRICTISV